MFFDDDGNLVMRGVVNAVDGGVICNGLQEAKDALFRAGHTEATWLDALVELCQRSLHTLDVCSRRDLFRVYIHLDSEGGWVHKGPALPPALLVAIMC